MKVNFEPCKLPVMYVRDTYYMNQPHLNLSESVGYN